MTHFQVRFLVLPFLTLAFAITGAVTAQALGKDERPPIEFSLPIGCKVGIDCHVQNYVDLDPGRTWTDYMCRGLSYEDNRGTEFRLPTFEMMEKGVKVRAAADGRIKAFRKTEKDKLYYQGDEAAVTGKACGNSIILEHEGGWETQYCHLKEGTALGVRGLNVKAGAQIGMVGMSGQTKVPQLVFLVRYNGLVVDPFSGATPRDGCRAPKKNLWAVEALPYLDYQATGLIDDGFAPETPTLSAIEESVYNAKSFTSAVTSLIYYARVFGLKEGDIQDITITAPDGSEIAHEIKRYDGRETPQFLRYIGQMRPEEGWQAGPYKGSYKLIRGTEVVVQSEKNIVLVQ